MTELKKRVDQLAREVAALTRQITYMPVVVGMAVLEAVKNKENTSPIGSSGSGKMACSYAEFKITQRSGKRRSVSKVDRARVGAEVLEMARTGLATQEIAESLRDKGIEISRSSISRYIHRYLFSNTGKED